MPFIATNVKVQDFFMGNDPRLSWILDNLPRVTSAKDIVFFAGLGYQDGLLKGLAFVKDRPVYVVRLDSSDGSVYVGTYINQYQLDVLMDFVYSWCRYKGFSVLYDATGLRTSKPPVLPEGAAERQSLAALQQQDEIYKAVVALSEDVRNQPPDLWFMGWGASFEDEDDA